MSNTKPSANQNKLIYWIAGVSLLINLVFLVVILMAKVGGLDNYFMSKGSEIMCSDSYRQLSAKQHEPNSVIVLDYQCQRDDDAARFFQEGYDKYLQSRQKAS